MDQMEARARAHRVQGDENMKQEKWDEALAALRAAVAEDPSMSDAWCAIGTAETCRHGRPCEAAYAPFKKCVELDPGHAGAHFGLGRILLRARDDDALAPLASVVEEGAEASVGDVAEAHLRECVRLAPRGPDSADAHIMLAGILERRDDLEGAARAMLEAVRLDESDGGRRGGGRATAARGEGRRARSGAPRAQGGRARGAAAPATRATRSPRARGETRRLRVPRGRREGPKDGRRVAQARRGQCAKRGGGACAAARAAYERAVALDTRAHALVLGDALRARATAAATTTTAATTTAAPPTSAEEPPRRPHDPARAGRRCLAIVPGARRLEARSARLPRSSARAADGRRAPRRGRADARQRRARQGPAFLSELMKRCARSALQPPRRARARRRSPRPRSPSTSGCATGRRRGRRRAAKRRRRAARRMKEATARGRAAASLLEEEAPSKASKNARKKAARRARDADAAARAPRRRRPRAPTEAAARARRRRPRPRRPCGRRGGYGRRGCHGRRDDFGRQ